MAAQWALGVVRLHGYQNRPGLRFIPLVLAALLVVGLILARSLAAPGAAFSGGPGKWLVALMVSPWMSVLWAVSFPLQAGYGSQAWLSGVVVAFSFTVIGLLLLAWSSTRLNLSRAAQESQMRRGSGMELWLADSRQAEEQRQRNRLGIGQAPSHRPIYPGSRAILWKNGVRFSRSRLLPQVWVWLSIFGLGLAILLIPDWGARAWAILVWALLVGQRSTSALQNDLALWSIFRQLPLTAERLIWMDILRPAALAVLLAWGGLAFGAILHAPFASFWVALLAPLLVIEMTMAAAFDVARQCHAADLLAGYVPQPGIVALFIGGVLVLIVILLAAWLDRIGLLLTVMLSLGSAYLLLNATANRLRRVR
jgi:hypothetical protein